MQRERGFHDLRLPRFELIGASCLSKPSSTTTSLSVSSFQRAFFRVVMTLPNATEGVRFLGALILRRDFVMISLMARLDDGAVFLHSDRRKPSPLFSSSLHHLPPIVHCRQLFFLFSVWVRLFVIFLLHVGVLVAPSGVLFLQIEDLYI